MTPDQVPGLITWEAGELLQRLAATVPAGRCIVELGAFQGRSTCYLATGSKMGARAPVYSIDPWDSPGNAPGKGGRFIATDNRAIHARHLEACKVADIVTPIQAFSQDAPLPPEPVGLLWIDGAHDPVSVAADVARWCPLVAAGGHLVIDDYGTWHPGVNQTVARLQRDPKWTDWSFAVRPLAWAVRR